jgi:glycosyltransferase involved in cell wall biosynthesis
MVLLEAMYFGSPVVSSRNGGSLTLIQDEIYGQIVYEFDIDKWCEAILKYLDNPQYAASVAEKGKEKIRNEYTWDIIVDKMISTVGLES